jgi:hypothetical protein
VWISEGTLALRIFESYNIISLSHSHKKGFHFW